MNKNKYYKVKEIQNSIGETEFKVYACESLSDLIFGFWTEYQIAHTTLVLAKYHIDELVKWKIRKIKSSSP